MNKKYYKHRRIGGRQGPMRLEHHLIWETLNGKIPDGYQIHHIDFDPKNNDIENLALVTVSEHQKIHSKHFGKLNGLWVRICKYCREINAPKKRPTCDKCRARMERIRRKKLSESKQK
jgi:hypothetical protein